MSLHKFHAHHDFANNTAAALSTQSTLNVPNSVKIDWLTRAFSRHWPAKVHRRQCSTEGCHIYDTLVLCRRTKILLAGFAVAWIGFVSNTAILTHSATYNARHSTFVLCRSCLLCKYHSNYSTNRECQKQNKSRDLKPVVDQSCIILMSHCNACLLQMIHRVSWSRGQTLQLAKRIPSVVYPASLLQKIWCHAWWYASKRCGAKRCGASRWHCYWQGLVVLVHADIWYLTTAAAKQDRGALSTFAVVCKLMLLLLVVLFPVEFSGGELASQVLSVILR